MNTKTFYFKVHGRYNGVEIDTVDEIRDQLFYALENAGFEFAIDELEGEDG